MKNLSTDYIMALENARTLQEILEDALDTLFDKIELTSINPTEHNNIATFHKPKEDMEPSRQLEVITSVDYMHRELQASILKFFGHEQIKNLLKAETFRNPETFTQGAGYREFVPFRFSDQYVDEVHATHAVETVELCTASSPRGFVDYHSSVPPRLPPQKRRKVVSKDDRTSPPLVDHQLTDDETSPAPLENEDTSYPVDQIDIPTADELLRQLTTFYD